MSLTLSATSQMYLNKQRKGGNAYVQLSFGLRGQVLHRLEYRPPARIVDLTYLHFKHVNRALLLHAELHRLACIYGDVLLK